jgi:hypothetical protein
VNKIVLFIFLVISLLGFLGGFFISYKNIIYGNACPNIWIIPACYIVTIGYALMIFASIKKQYKIFFTGWVPVFILAFFGSVMELLGNDTCPKSAAGIPMCFYSLLIVVLVGLLFLNLKKANNNREII